MCWEAGTGPAALLALPHAHPLLSRPAQGMFNKKPQA